MMARHFCEVYRVKDLYLDKRSTNFEMQNVAKRAETKNCLGILRNVNNIVIQSRVKYVLVNVIIHEANH